MRHVLGLLGIAAAFVLLGVSAAMNWQFGFGLGKTEFDSQVYGAASVAADCMKALLPFFIFAAIRKKTWSQALAAVCLSAICLTYSLTSSLGFASLNRADTIGERQLASDAHKDIRFELDQAKAKIGLIPEHRPAAEVSVDLQALMTKPVRKWRGGKRQTVADVTGDCTVSTKWTRRHCPQILNLRKELEVAREAERLETKVSTLRAKLEETRGSVVTAQADPQAETLSKLTGLSMEHIQLGLILLVALLVEVGSSLGFYVVFSQWKLEDEKKPVTVATPKTSANDNDRRPAEILEEAKPLVAPETDVERFHKERIVAAEGNSLTATELYEEYCDWCEDEAKEPMALPTFGRQFGELGVQKAKIAGRIRYIGIKAHLPEGVKSGQKKLAA